MRKNIFQEYAALWIMLIAIIVVAIFFTYAPNSWIQALGEMSPDEHYESGVRIRTVRGQDFIVSGFGKHETLVPIAPIPDEGYSPPMTNKPKLEE